MRMRVKYFNIFAENKKRYTKNKMTIQISEIPDHIYYFRVSLMQFHVQFKTHKKF